MPLPASSQVRWEHIAPNSGQKSPSELLWEPIEMKSSGVVWTPFEDNEDEKTPTAPNEPPGHSSPMHRASLPPPPKLRALNRSIAYSDGMVGPDIGWQVPNGFRWSERWFGDVSVRAFSRRSKKNEESFWAWNNGDGTALISLNLIQSGNWSIGLNSSFRSLYQGNQAAGGSTRVGEGFSSGFRISTEIGDTGGIAFGGEQILQWDDKTDTGRNFYLMATKGWRLKSQDFPVFITNGGFGTGRFANQGANNKTPWINPNRFGCIYGVQNRSGSFSVDNDLCWSPIGSAGVVFNESAGMFLEYWSGNANISASANLNQGIPIRLTFGLDFLRKNEMRDPENMTWVFRASLGF